MTTDHGLWRRFTTELLRVLGPERFATWTAHARPATLDEEAFVFVVADAGAREKLEAAFRSAVTDVAQRVTNRNVRVKLAVEDGAFPGGADGTAPAPRPETFATFVAGPSNRAALEAARRFARGGPRTLLIHGGSGLGKTHLLRAVEDDLRRRSALPLLTSGPRFRRQLAWAELRGRREAFLTSCTAAGALLLDDVHLLAGRVDAQAAVVAVLDDLAARGARVAVSSARPVRAIDGLTGPLRTRLRTDVEAVLDAPDAATGAAVLAAAAPAVPRPVLDYIAAHVRSSHADQLRCLSRVLRDGPPGLAGARAAVSEFLNRWSQGLTYGDIVRAAADCFGVPMTAIYADERSRAATDARRACYYLARKLLREPFAHIGEHFGGRDHATVLEACRRLERDPGELLLRLQRLERLLGGLKP